MTAIVELPTLLDGEALLQDLEDLGAIGVTPNGGLNRLAFNPADRAGREWVATRMRELGMKVITDPAGNTIATLPGSDPHLRPIALGSHTDTVPDGGRYDGALGVLAALACVRTLRGAGFQTRHPLVVINFTGEEATLGGGTFGSRAMTGQLDPATLNQPAWDGRPADEILREAGVDPVGILQARHQAGSLAAFLELHIEQGGRLEAADIPIGVVEGIVGIRRYGVTVPGTANHAGTTPMDQRDDALVKAAPFILAVRDVATAQKIVGTVGTLHVRPGASNVIPGRVELTCEIRGLDEAVLDRAADELARRAAALGAEWRMLSRKEAVACDRDLQAAIVAACKELGLAHRRMPSGAGHDAMCMAAIAPTAMIFVPSQGGISHAPAEYTAPEACVAGARVLLAALLQIDALGEL